LVRDIVENRQYHLLEALAEAIAAVLLEQRHAQGVRVRVAKTPPVRGGFDRFAVVIERERPAG
ncbi:MAG TPA: dihydroneopterin aldolase, partial [Candidatus Dormibacteraeota bacterium]